MPPALIASFCGRRFFVYIVSIIINWVKFMINDLPENFRTYGNVPFHAALIHGGPGAAGEMAPLAGQLRHCCNILEPLQTADSVSGQINELKIVLERQASLPVVLVGHSWGAWLGFMFAANFPSYVKKLILVGSGSFEDKYAQNIHQIRMERLNSHDRQEVERISEKLSSGSPENKDDILKRFGGIISRADQYDPAPDTKEDVCISYHIYKKVWLQAAAMRSSGELLALAEKITCPLVAFHGDYDPHPEAGVREPLSGIIQNFRFILLERCGHKPWLEKQAREYFLNLLLKELAC